MPANSIIRVSNVTACTTPKSTDLLLGASYNTESETGTDYVNMSFSYDALTSNLVSNNFTVSKNTTPANSSATSGLSVGQIWSDGTYIYVVTSNTVIKRAALSTF